MYVKMYDRFQRLWDMHASILIYLNKLSYLFLNLCIINLQIEWLLFNVKLAIFELYQWRPLYLKVGCQSPNSIQHYVIKFVSDLRQVGGFLLVLRFSSANKTDHHDITEILLKVTLNTINPIILHIWNTHLRLILRNVTPDY